MIARRLLAAAAAAALVPLGTTAVTNPVDAAPAKAGSATVTVANMTFSPFSVTVGLGSSVTWSFADSVAHTTTSDQGFWNSGVKPSGTSYTRVFGSAGSFAYHCNIHPEMHGEVRVLLTANGTAAKGYKLSWATARATGKIAFDVQTRKGHGRWKPLRTGTTRASARFNPAMAGTYQVRARTDKGAKHAGWSPAVRVTIS
jgi:plastocyanin